MKNRNYVLALVAALLVLVAGVVVATRRWQGRGPTQPPADPTTPVSIRFPIPIFESGQASFYLADDRGYFKKEGLDVAFQMGSKELNPVKMVATGQDMFGVLGGPDTVLVARSKGQKIKAIAVLHRNSNFPCLITLKSSGITTLQQLAGKKIGFYYGHISTDVLHSLLHRNHVEYQEIDVGFDYSQLIAGQVDAEWGFTVTAGLDLPAKGVEVNIISPAEYGIITHGYTLFASEATLRDKPDLVLKVLRAALKGVGDSIADPEAATRSLMKRDPKLPFDLNLKRQKAYNAVASNSERFPVGYMDEEMFRSAYDRLVEEKVIETPFDPREAFTTEFLAQVSH